MTSRVCPFQFHLIEELLSLYLDLFINLLFLQLYLQHSQLAFLPPGEILLLLNNVIPQEII